MTKLFNTISSTAEERIKNPFTGTFIVSWVAFNWKPLVFFIFSKQDIDEKINFIVQNYSDHWNLIWYPLISCLFFLFIVPYINLTNDFFTKKSKDKRESTLHDDKILKIQRETKEEEEKAKREIAIEIVREQKGRNQQAEDLRKNIEDLESDLSAERNRFQQFNNEHSQIVNKLRQENMLTQSELTKERTNNINLNLENKKLQGILRDRHLEDVSLAIHTDENFNNTQFISGKFREYLESKKLAKQPKLFKLDNREIFEILSINNVPTFFDVNSYRQLSYSEISHLFNEVGYDVVIINNRDKMMKMLEILDHKNFKYKEVDDLCDYVD